jgi:hypothetical protein
MARGVRLRGAHAAVRLSQAFTEDRLVEEPDALTVGEERALADDPPPETDLHSCGRAGAPPERHPAVPSRMPSVLRNSPARKQFRNCGSLAGDGFRRPPPRAALQRARRRRLAAGPRGPAVLPQGRGGRGPARRATASRGHPAGPSRYGAELAGFPAGRGLATTREPPATTAACHAVGSQVTTPLTRGNQQDA